MGWIFQYALVDREGTHDLRELRLLNESLVKPALQSAPASPKSRRSAGSRSSIRSSCFRRCSSERGISLRQVLARRPGRVSGGRRPHDRGDQPRVPAARRRRRRRASTSSSSSSSAATGRAARAAEGRRLPAGRLRPAARHRRSRRRRRGRRRHRHHGAGPQRPGRHAARCCRSSTQLKPSLPDGHRDRPDLQPLGADLGHADELLPGASSTS